MLLDSLNGTSPDLKDKVRETYGFEGYNRPPKGFRELTENEFAKSHFFIYTPEMIGYDQIYIDTTKKFDMREQPLVQLKLFFMHDRTGYAMGHDYYAGKIRYFKFGCNHAYREMTKEESEAKGIKHFGRCYHVEECMECGYIREYDSGD